MPATRMIDIVVETKFSIFTPSVREVLDRHYVACFVNRIIGREVVDELIEECADDIMVPSGNDAKDIYQFAEGSEEEHFQDGWYYMATEKCLLEALTLRDQLSGLPINELKELYDKALLVKAQELKRRRIECEIDAFFHQPHALADFDYWTGIDVLTPEEGVALTLGKNPRFVNAISLAESFEKDSPFATEFDDRVRRVRRAIEGGSLLDPIRPKPFAIWSLENLPESDEGFGAWCRALLSQRDAPLEADEMLADGNTSVSKLLVGMAIRHYGFEKSYSADDKSKSFQEIVDDLARAGLTIDVKTVRKYLVAGNTLLHERGAFRK